MTTSYLLSVCVCVCVPVEGIDPTYQPDSQNRRSALHAAAQRGLLEVCYMLIQVRNESPGYTCLCFFHLWM